MKKLFIFQVVILTFFNLNVRAQTCFLKSLKKYDLGYDKRKERQLFRFQGAKFTFDYKVGFFYKKN